MFAPMYRRIGVLAAVALLGVASLAFAGTRRATTIVASHTVGSATAKCPKHQQVGFAGFLADGTLNGAFPAGLARPSKKTVQASGAALSANAGPVTAIAYCSKDAPNLKVVSQTAVVPGAARDLTVTATCPKGRTVAFGGWASDLHYDPAAGSDVYINGLFRSSSRGWTARASNHNAAGDKAGSLTSLAYCKKGAKPKAVSQVVSVPPGTFGNVSAKCPGGKEVVAGGFTADSRQTALDPVVQISSMQRSSKRVWTVSGYSNGGIPGNLTAIAYCA
jgi:hypothetical protein